MIQSIMPIASIFEGKEDVLSFQMQESNRDFSQINAQIEKNGNHVLQFPEFESLVLFRKLYNDDTESSGSSVNPEATFSPIIDSYSENEESFQGGYEMSSSSKETLLNVTKQSEQIQFEVQLSKGVEEALEDRKSRLSHCELNERKRKIVELDASSSSLTDMRTNPEMASGDKLTLDSPERLDGWEDLLSIAASDSPLGIKLLSPKMTTSANSTTLDDSKKDKLFQNLIKLRQIIPGSDQDLQVEQVLYRTTLYLRELQAAAAKVKERSNSNSIPYSQEGRPNENENKRRRGSTKYVSDNSNLCISTSLLI